MAIEDINIGTVPNDGTGDTLRGGAEKINNNNFEFNQQIQLNDNAITALSNSKVDSVTGDLVDNTDPLNPIVTNPYKSQADFFDLPSNNFNSTVPTDVPDMQFTINSDGEFVFFSVINCNNDQNEEIDFFIALTPLTTKVVNGNSLTAGIQFTFVGQVITDRQQKNQDQSIQGTFALDNLEVGDIISFQLDTRGDNVDLTNRRYLAQSWG